MVTAALKFCLVAFVASLCATAQNTTEFCSTRKTGLYCSTSTRFQKIHCPSGNIMTCPLYPTEICQERGLLHNSTGIARCVPWLNSDAVASFCKTKVTGVYCWGDLANNIKVQCPLGLVYKCEDVNYGLPTSQTCFMKNNNTAACKVGGQTGGGGNGAGGGNCSAIAITFVSTVTKTQALTQLPQTFVQTVTASATFNQVVTTTVTLVQQCPITTSQVIYVTRPTVVIETSTIYNVSTPSPILCSSIVTISSTPFLTSFISTAPFVSTPATARVSTSTFVSVTSTAPVSTSTFAPVTSTAPVVSSSRVLTSTFVPVTSTIPVASSTGVPTSSTSPVASSTGVPASTFVPVTSTVLVVSTTRLPTSSFVPVITPPVTSSIISSSLVASTSAVPSPSATPSISTSSIFTSSIVPTSTAITPQRTTPANARTSRNQFSTSTLSPTITRNLTVTTTVPNDGGGGGGAADVTVIPVIPGSNTDCSNYDGTTLLRPWERLPGTNYTYVLTTNKVTEFQAVSICRSLGGRIAWISSTDEHWWLGGKICEPVWYRTWNGDSYDTQDVVSGCIALYPGGTTNVPPGDCQALLHGLCKV